MLQDNPGAGPKGDARDPEEGMGRRGPIAKSAAPTRLDRLDVPRGAVLRLTRRTDAPFANNRTERDIRMARV